MIDVSPVRWSELFHAYGSATDTPGHLTALTSDDGSRVSASLQHLLGAVVHQGTPWSATAPAARVVAGTLRAVAPGVRVRLLAFLDEVADVAHWLDVDAARAAGYPADAAEAAAVDSWVAEYAAADEDTQEELWEDKRSEAVMQRAAVDCHDLVPELLDPVVAELGSPEREVRAAAVAAVATIAGHPALAGRRVGLAASLAEAARTADGAERCSLALGIGCLGAEPRELLDDPELPVRVCAALAPALARDERATGILAAALSDPAGLDDAFPVLPGIGGKARHRVVAALTTRVTDFSRLVDGAVAVLGLLVPRYPDPDLAPFLEVAFAAGWPEPGQATGAQRRYAHAVAGVVELWNPINDNRAAILRSHSLPDDRDAWASL